MSMEMEIMKERIEELEDVLNGTIREHGSFNYAEHKFDINTSAILTKLIQEAGRWCCSYASDLFIEWKYNVDQPLANGTMTDTKLMFCFREFGVDDENAYMHNQSNYYYYRSVWTLTVKVDNGKINMVLEKGDQR